jgi:hypothetical protein
MHATLLLRAAEDYERDHGERFGFALVITEDDGPAMAAGVQQLIVGIERQLHGKSSGDSL